MASFEEKENIDYAIQKFKELFKDTELDNSHLDNLNERVSVLGYQVDKMKENIREIFKRLRGLEKKVKLLEEDSSFSE